MIPFRLAYLASAAAVAAGAVLMAHGAAAAEGAQLQGYGWWTQLNPGNGVPFPSPTDVPSKGLLVESDINGSPLAYAALVFELPTSSEPSTLALNVAPNSATTPNATIELCPLLQPTLKAEEGGPSADGPSYDCSTPISATPDAAGTVYRFDVSSLPSTGALGVAILPNAPSDRVVFDEPKGGWLAVTSQATAPGPVPFGSTPVQSSGSLSSGAPSVAPVVSSAGGSTPVMTPSVAAPAAGHPQPQLAPAASKPAAAVGSESSPSTAYKFTSFTTSVAPASPLAAALIVAGLLGGVALWFYAGRRRADELTA